MYLSCTIISRRLIHLMDILSQETVLTHANNWKFSELCMSSCGSLNFESLKNKFWSRNAKPMLKKLKFETFWSFCHQISIAQYLAWFLCVNLYILSSFLKLSVQERSIVDILNCWWMFSKRPFTASSTTTQRFMHKWFKRFDGELKIDSRTPTSDTRQLLS